MMKGCSSIVSDEGTPPLSNHSQALLQRWAMVDTTYTLYQQQRTVFTADFYGCFYYGYLPDEQTLRIHFINRETAEQGALSQARQVVRMQE
jgi:hypothetical protein